MYSYSYNLNRKKEQVSVNLIRCLKPDRFGVYRSPSTDPVELRASFDGVCVSGYFVAYRAELTGL
jgi:hypothetical protein